jgi:uncharacterized lipoprotein YddW (UPF0748 family)
MGLGTTRQDKTRQDIQYSLENGLLDVLCVATYRDRENSRESSYATWRLSTTKVTNSFHIQMAE